VLLLLLLLSRCLYQQLLWAAHCLHQQQIQLLLSCSCVLLSLLQMTCLHLRLLLQLLAAPGGPG
jgi:hypothetical protein